MALAALFCATPVAAQESPRIAERTAQTDIPLEGPRGAVRLPQVTLAITVAPEGRSISGRAVMTVQPTEQLEQLQFDLAPRFTIDAVYVGEQSVDRSDYANPDGLLTIDLPQAIPAGEPVEVTIGWSGQPHEAVNPPWDGGIVWAETPEGQPWIATAIQGEGCDMFWPCIDHSSVRIGTLDLLISVPTPLVAAANGRLVWSHEVDENTVWHWQARDPNNYGVTLQIAPYEVAERDYESRFGNTIPLRFWHLTGNEEGANRLLGEMADQITFMEERFGPYPFGDEKAGVAETPHLGMEHQTINAYGNRFRPESNGHDWLLQHEFAHEWFANQLTHASINHMWLHEGITTWTQPLYLEWARGEMLYDAEMWRQRQRVWSRVPLVPPEGELPDYNDREARWGDDIYFKGSWIMHTLRYLVGDEALFPAITMLTYGTHDPEPGNLAPVSRTTEDFRQILQDSTGRDLEWFFDAYFYQAEMPRLDVMQDGDMLTLRWHTPSRLPFAMPVEVRIGDEVRTVAMADGHGRIELDWPSQPYLVDPRNRILRYDADVEAWQNRDPAQ
ncbi:hypothetical protein AAW01_08540 [Aurantiacibacter gangjinensis]|uniref:Peptidase M1 membrane alanine aminopeptidase domain-containing protein n=1 Tax=Aurantiacibacter gangjinensis TaxID=502682 RepID=A0A0G9MNB9_9SPHN|nr:hypothetical protein AAW01_08540 [Aurantiacibacter gangjinensis]